MLHLHYNVGDWLGASGVSNVRHADLVLTVSEFICGQVLALGLPATKVVAILNSVVVRPALKSPEAEGQRDDLRIAVGARSVADVVITMVSRIDPFKDHADVIRAVAGLDANAVQLGLHGCSCASSSSGA